MPITSSSRRVDFCDWISIVVKTQRLIISTKSFSDGILHIPWPESCLHPQPQSIFLPHYRCLRRFTSSRCHLLHQKDILNRASDEIALSGSQQLANLCRSPSDTFDPVLCSSQIILQTMVSVTSPLSQLRSQLSQSTKFHCPVEWQQFINSDLRNQ
jgi:hypothetical protein